KSSKTSSGLGGKIFRQLAPADFSVLVSWERLKQEDSLRHLPAAQPRPTKLQQHRFVGPFRGDDTGNDLLVAHRGRPAEDHCLPHTFVAQKLRLHFRRVYLFARDIDYIRKPPNNADP